MTAFLPTGYRLTFQDHPGEYLISGVIGRGASTIAYAAEYYDGKNCPTNKIIKEYCPLNISLHRECDGNLVCSEQDQGMYQRGKDSFIAGGQYQNEIRNRLRLQNETPFLSGIHTANNTVYLEVAPFHGKILDDIQDLTLLQRIRICLAVAKLVAGYHAEGFLCLDLKPSNIFVLQNSSDEVVTDLIEYIDFDSIRRKESVSFGNSLSFTEEWAAPEQKTPYGYKKVCEATDVYAVGELMFWLIFGRHSLPRERRDSSCYPFSEPKADNSVLQRVMVRKLIQSILHHSIRSSISNRFSSMNDMVVLLRELVEELTKKHGLITSPVHIQRSFYGRKAELAEIEAKLADNKVVFVSGIPGIGKSVLVKQYIHLHKSLYDNVLLWNYDGDLDSMVSWENTVRIANFTRLSEENDAQYAKRKLEFLGELLDGQKNLIFIDNIDKPIEELRGQDTLRMLFSLPGKIVIGTRATETLYPSIKVNQLSEMDELVDLFCFYCPVRAEEKAAVYEIIDIVGRHTLLVELMAHYSIHRGPEKTLQILHEQGFIGLQDEQIRFLKDNSVLSESVSLHIERLFSMDSMTDEQLLTLAKLALLPSTGVETRKFAAFYAIDNFNHINWLLHHGWMACGRGEYATLQLHTTIATVVMEHLKRNPDLLTKLYVDCYDAIRIRKPQDFEPAEEVLYADAIAMATKNRYHITVKQAGIFLQQYVGITAAYGNNEAKLQFTEYAIEVLEAASAPEKYSAIIEYAYRRKVSCLVTMDRFDEAISIAHQHLQKAQRAADLYTIADWYYSLSHIYGVYRTKSSEWLTYKYYFLGALYVYRMECDAKKKLPRFFNTTHLLENLDYDYIERSKGKFINNLYLGFANWMENQEAGELFCSKGGKTSINLLKRAIGIRAKVDNDPNSVSNNNRFEMIIDQARIDFLDQRYEEAEKQLTVITSFADQHRLLPTSTLYRVHQFLGHIALRRDPIDRDTAIAEFEHCLYIAEKMDNHNTYAVRLELGFQYLMAGEIEKAKPIVMDLWQETRALAHEVRKTYRADALRNMAFLHLAEGTGYTANNLLKGSEAEYDKALAPYPLKQFGKGRAYAIKAEIILRHGKGQAAELKQLAIQWLEIAQDLFKDTVGLDHPEALACQARLTELKTRS